MSLFHESMDSMDEIALISTQVPAPIPYSVPTGNVNEAQDDHDHDNAPVYVHSMKNDSTHFKSVLVVVITIVITLTVICIVTLVFLNVTKFESIRMSTAAGVQHTVDRTDNQVLKLQMDTVSNFTEKYCSQPSLKNSSYIFSVSFSVHFSKPHLNMRIPKFAIFTTTLQPKFVLLKLHIQDGAILETDDPMQYNLQLDNFLPLNQCRLQPNHQLQCIKSVSQLSGYHSPTVTPIKDIESCDSSKPLILSKGQYYFIIFQNETNFYVVQDKFVKKIVFNANGSSYFSYLMTEEKHFSSYIGTYNKFKWLKSVVLQLIYDKDLLLFFSTALMMSVVILHVNKKIISCDEIYLKKTNTSGSSLMYKIGIFSATILRVASSDVSIEVPPQSVNASIGELIELVCVVNGETGSFLVDSVPADRDTVVMKGFNQSIIEILKDGLIQRTISTVASVANDNTTIICLVRTFINLQLIEVRSDPAIIRVQGRLSSVSNLKYTFITPVSINVSWDEPFTLSGTNITGYNISVNHESDFFTQNLYFVLRLTNFTTSPCTPLTITVAGYNGLNGENASLSTVFLPEKLTSFDSNRVRIVRINDNDNDPILIRINVTGLCEGQFPSYLSVTIKTDAESQLVLPNNTRFNLSFTPGDISILTSGEVIRSLQVAASYLFSLNVCSVAGCNLVEISYDIFIDESLENSTDLFGNNTMLPANNNTMGNESLANGGLTPFGHGYFLPSCLICLGINYAVYELITLNLTYGFLSMILCKYV